ncbi:MAG: helix-turn-helix transcriptional regulator [Selenomonas sp.]|uniref:helix-turn-helix domain-containing protein n=1 Tax=Selenomonas sp. TaxID=2053611 RepID=UPI0025E8C674|nr:helix-turn-helix transcriptional regulator [Selenomonas sp.]MCR5757115.1 helix-turn-helix transcriptional regulator [Selenomonas sp.]
MNYTKGGFPVWDDEFDKEHFTPEEIAESDLRVALITSLVQARKEQGLSQRDLEKISGVKQPQIARMERGDANPQLDTILKLLAAMGKTLAVVPLPSKT